VQRLRLTEIFYSLQGETRTVGLPTVFVRLTGCPLRCGYCDTEYAFSGGNWFSLEEILEKVQSYNAHYVTVTGGEPLAQKTCLDLLTQLCDQGYEVSLETSGALDISQVDPRVVKVVDLKTPGSKECDKNLYENIQYLLPHDQVKFVICNREDYDWCKDVIKKYSLTNCCEVLFSPSYREQDPGQLADWILADNLSVRLQIQLHKMLWGDVKGK
jgi:7-carboxy-7-deazaguanine synthase